jgi:dienelactone hydrolase
MRAEEAIPDDPALAELRTAVGAMLTIETEPAGAQVSRREYATDEGAWEELGTTPIDGVLVPRSTSRYRVELEGYQTVEFLEPGGGIRRFPLQPVDPSSAGMAWVEGFTAVIGGERVELGDFFIGRYEVTNEAYKEFIDAGGYERPEFWEHPFVEDGRTLSWEAGLARFTDRTGRPGPATWEVGSYPEGQDDYPVSGVSWYEAAAYARFAGKSLPTVHHWNSAFNAGHQAYLIPQSNLEGTAPDAVGANRGVSWSGAFDMAGNVREWCLNESGNDRYIMGGGWNDPAWLAYGSFAQSPFDRSETNGIRLVMYPSAEGLSAAEMPVAPDPTPDYTAFEPVTDEVLELYRRLFAYDPAPLEDRIEAVDTAKYWTRETVTFDAAYGDERMILHLFLPRDRDPPFQSVVFMPGSNALTTRSIDGINPASFDFFLKSGRAVALPAYRGTLERETAFAQRAQSQGLRFNSTPRSTSYYREHVIQWVKDVGRTIDYLELRPETDAESLAFYGSSWGGRMGAIMLALEPRFDVGILRVAGFSPAVPQPEVHAVTYAPRVSVPVLMLSGRYDHIFPLETQARPMFERLGTAPEHKRQVVSAGGHFVPRTDLIRESLAWLDRYLGPVR